MTPRARPRFVAPRRSRMISGIKARMVTAYACPYISSSLYMDEQFFVLPHSRRPTDGDEPPFRSIPSREEKENGVEEENRAAAPRFLSLAPTASPTPLVPSFPVKWFPHCAGCKDGQTGGILTSFVQLDITGLEEVGGRVGAVPSLRFFP